MLTMENDGASWPSSTEGTACGSSLNPCASTTSNGITTAAAKSALFHFMFYPACDGATLAALSGASHTRRRRGHKDTIDPSTNKGKLRHIQGTMGI